MFVYTKLFQSCLILYEPWVVAHQVLLSIGFSRQEYWSRLPCTPPGDLPEPGIKPMSLALKASSLPLASPGKANMDIHI